LEILVGVAFSVSAPRPATERAGKVSRAAKPCTLFSMDQRHALAAALLSTSMTMGCGNGDYVIGRFQDDACSAHDDALLCSGFERPDLSDWMSLVVADAHVEQSEKRSHGGDGSLFAESTGQKSSAVVAKEFSPVKQGELYLRAFLYVPDGLPTKTMNIFFLGDYATPDPFRGVDFNLEDGALSTYSPRNQPDRFTSTTLAIPRDRWFCLQIEMTVSEDAGAVTMLVDGEIGLEQKNVNTRPPAGVHLLRAGIDWSSGQTEPFNFYLDDLVLDTAPIDCTDP
jgi:hypothetical protein